MKKIIKIVIKGCSGYGPIDAAFKDKVIIDSSSISYEYTPLENSETNPSRKWKYTTTGSEFKRLYDELVGKMPNIIYREIDFFCTDIGEIEFIVTYEDKTKWKNTFFVPGDEFDEIFSTIKQMVPRCEEIPNVLLTEADFDN